MAALAMRRHPTTIPRSRQPDAVDVRPNRTRQELPCSPGCTATSPPCSARSSPCSSLAFVLIVLLFAQLARRVTTSTTTEADLERVEAGAALFASQVTGFQSSSPSSQPTVSAGLDEAIAGLETFGTSTIEFDVAIDENLPIDTEVVIDRTFEVPIKTTLPINESVRHDDPDRRAVRRRHPARRHRAGRHRRADRPRR